ncbi:MAG: hypothetical protein JNK58_06085 [Phycisphaerae bacterium]|nr:hypothetical protein [Phycisphaerae bacterium]
MLKTTGRVAALLLVSGVVGVLLIGVVRSSRGPASAPAVQPRVDFGLPPDVSNAGEGSGGGSPQDLIALADEGAWTRVDPATGRVRFRMTWSRLDPEAKGEFRIERPRIWMIEDGRTLRLESSRANVVWPSREEAPESGELLGGVALSAFEGEAFDDASLKNVSAIGSMRTEAMGFNQAARELSARGEVELEAAGVKASGEGMTLRLGGDRSAPITLLRIERGGRVEYRASEAERSGARVTEGTRATSSKPTEEPVERCFRLTTSGGVSLRSGERSLSGEGLTLFARTVDGRLREGAVASFDSERRGGSQNTRPSRADESDSMLVTWGGAMEFRVLREAPAELMTDDAHARINGGEGDVVLEDAAAKRRLSAASVAYAATTRRIVALGGAAGVNAEIGDVARVRAERFELDLTSGEGAIAGAGEARLLGRGGGGARWREGAVFSLDASDGPVGSSDGVVVKQIRLSGGVGVFRGESGLESDSLRVMFDRVERDGAASSSMSRVAASGGARAHDARGGKASGEDIDVLFERDPDGEPVPTIATIRGGAVAERRDESLRADLIEALLSRGADGEVQIGSVEALDHVVGLMQREGGTITVRARSLRADASVETAELIGEPVTIERRSAKGSGMLSGRSMRLEGREGMQRLTVFGAGSSRYTGASSDGTPMVVDVEWDGGLIYTDATGRAEVEGGASARLASGEDERHSARGERIVVDLTPAADAARLGGERELVRALIEGETDAPAEVELRRYVAGTRVGEGGTLEGLAFLRGASVELLGGGSRLRVEGAGVLLLEDRRAASAGVESKGEGIELKGMRGTTLFSWEGGLSLDRAAGTGELTDGVLIRHKDAATSEIAEVASQRATMSLAETRPGSGSLEGITLTRAEAAGGVTARYKALQLSSARLIYEAGGRIIAASEPGGSITIYDESEGRSISGEAAVVDTATGRYRIERMESLSMPR